MLLLVCAFIIIYHLSYLKMRLQDNCITSVPVPGTRYLVLVPFLQTTVLVSYQQVRVPGGSKGHHSTALKFSKLFFLIL